jgi:hypothetical protein
VVYRTGCCARDAVAVAVAHTNTDGVRLTDADTNQHTGR